jgi:predicted nuclease of predicted toxin-antitoxin system
MRIVLDSNVHRGLKQHLLDLDCVHVRDLGLQDLKDGPLLDAIDSAFDALVTLDKNLPYQQNLGKRNFAVIVIHAKSSRLSDLLPAVAELRQALAVCRPSHVYEVGWVA